MKVQGWTVEDFMNPYVLLNDGDCSRIFGGSVPSILLSDDEVAKSESFPGWEYFDAETGSLGMLIDVGESECNSDLFWNGRSSTTNLQNGRLFVKEMLPSSFSKSIELKFQWTGSCPEGVSQWVQEDSAFLADPG